MSVVEPEVARFRKRGWVEAIQEGSRGVKLVALRSLNRSETVLIPDSILQQEQVSLQSTVELLCEETDDGVPLATAIEVKGRAAPLPVELENPDYTDTRYRHLHIRTPLLRATAMFRHYIQKYAREYLDEHGFYYVNTPILTEASCVCSGDVFTFPYYDKKIATLIQSPWMYADALVAGVERVYALNPSFRREREPSGIHLVEIWQLQVDGSWLSNNDVMALEEELVQSLASRLAANHADLYGMAGLSPTHLDAMSRPFERITYDESVERLRKLGHDINYGDDYSLAQSDALSSTFDRPYFVTDYPQQLKNFWFPTSGARDGVRRTPSNDLFAHTGHGELIGGGERVYRAEELETNLEYFGHDLDEFDWFLETRQFGCVPHAGFSIGFDRLTAFLMGVDHIGEATLFPRMPHGTLRP